MSIARVLGWIIASPFILISRLLGVRRPPMVHLPQDDPDMAAAIANARSTLPEFRRRLAAPEPGTEHYGIKAAFPAASGGHEHCWVGELDPQGAGFVGKLTVHPQDVPGLELGSRVEVTEDMISDWSYSKDGVYQGHYTTKALLPAMTAQLRERVCQAYGWTPSDFAPKS